MNVFRRFDIENPNRLNLARWLVDTKNPLTARVTANRIWQSFFGSGIVKTADDFGIQGEKPTHPELLDWLASELMASNWDVKHLVRLIVTSSTYQQSSKATPESHANDPANRLLARGPRSRLPSWMIRDQALAVSGLLNSRIGGPSFKPYQPAGVWEEATFGKKRYQQDRGANLYRRSLYIFWRRIVGPTMLFDAGKRQTCSVVPSKTNTPLHALVTLNDTAFVEAARNLAQLAIQHSPEKLHGQIRFAFRSATSRFPTDQELQLLTRRFEKTKSEFESNQQDAHQLLKVGESIPDKSIQSIELAAMTTTCLLILNLDETLNN